MTYHFGNDAETYIKFAEFILRKDYGNQTIIFCKF